MKFYAVTANKPSLSWMIIYPGFLHLTAIIIVLYAEQYTEILNKRDSYDDKHIYKT